MFLIGFTQNQDEIKNLLLEVKDASYFDSTLMFNKGNEVLAKSNISETKSELYIYYGSYFFYIKDYKKAVEYFNLSLIEAKKANSKHFSNLAQIRLAFLDFEKGHSIIAEKKLKILLKKAEIIHDYRNMAEIYNFNGIILESQNEYKKAAEIYYKGLLLAEEKNLYYYSGVFKNNLGLIKLFSGDIDNAIFDLNSGLELARKDNNKRLENHLKLNICLGYIFKKEYEKTKEYFDDVIKYAKNNNFPTELSNIYANFGSILINNNNLDTASSYYDSAIVILKKNDFDIELSVAYYGKARIFMKKGKYKEAQQYLSLAEEINKITKNQENISTFFSLSYEVYLEQKNYKKALECYENYISIRDSIKEKMNDKIINDLQYNYKVQQKEVELEKEKAKSMLLEISNEKEKLNKWIAIGVAIILLTITLIYFYNRYLRKIKEKQEQFSRMLIKNIEEERKRISMDLHDDIGQSLSIIKSKVISISDSNSKNDIEGDLARVINQTREISRNLYPSSLEKIGLIRAVASLMQDLQTLKGLECSYDITESILNTSKEIQTNVYRIIQECVNNTIKHSGATGLKVTIEKTDNEYILTYKDNGIGLASKRKSDGIGLLSIQERAKIIKGNVELNEKGEKGFKLILKFKHE